MRRWAALLLLVVIATFLAISGADRCHDEGAGHSQPSAHILCIDDCTPVLLPSRLAAPAPDPLPKSVYAVPLADAVLNLDLEPEKTPPRL